MKSKKVILFIVEGVTDKNSLSLILSKLISNSHIRFHIVGGDITTNKNTTIQNCITKVNDEINKFLSISKFKKNDILEVIHLVDTDGVYIKDEFVKLDSTNNIIYKSDCMLTDKVELTIERNRKKTSILDKLSTNSKVSRIPYCMYYFSCNLEHVLHNEQNLDDSLKTKYSYDFEDEYYGKELEFKNFIQNSEFSVKGSYKETWDFIKVNNNSLNRFSNLGLFFENNL
ncbi:hypothetical protein [Clostridium sp. C8]|uniref:hypothetical protein n=1 Tax=Clostridium sp. C8 TaxID=1667357 RepID=UPI00062E4E44|nr:hypothetical protein [Clostridium sp. C8]KLE17144.1 hypothetical protein AAT22_02085 [Clostridium sp. C8]